MVVNRILEHWNSLTPFFQRAALEDNLPSAVAILEQLRNPLNKLYFLLLSYMLQIISKANAEFQSEKSKVPLIWEKMTSMYKLILGCFIKRKVINSTPIKNISVANPHNYLDIRNIFCGVNVDLLLSLEPTIINDTDKQNFKLRCLEFYVKLCTQIKTRFDFGNEYFAFAANFTPQVAISGEKLSIAEAVNLFPHLNLNIEEVNIEWQLISVTKCF